MPSGTQDMYDAPRAPSCMVVQPIHQCKLNCVASRSRMCQQSLHQSMATKKERHQQGLTTYCQHCTADQCCLNNMLSASVVLSDTFQSCQLQQPLHRSSKSSSIEVYLYWLQARHTLPGWYGRVSKYGSGSSHAAS